MDESPIDMGGPSASPLASNPRAAQVRIEAASASRAGGQRAHDLRLGPQPSYVDADRTPLNRILIRPQTGTELRHESERRRNQRSTKRAMKANAGVGFVGIITFGHEAQQLFRRLSSEEQDAAYRELAEAVAQRLNTTLTGLVVHEDESAPHAHFQMVGYCLDGTPISKIAKRATLRELQDLTAEVMGRRCPGVERGHSKVDRLKGGAKPSDVVNWSVAELHDRLPGQIAELRARVTELEGALTAAEEKAQKNEALAQEAIAKARAAKAADAERARKAQRNIEAYERRAAAAREDAEALRREVEALRARAEDLHEKETLLTREEERLEAKREELDARQTEINGAQETADTIRQNAENDAAARKDTLDRAEAALVQRQIAEAECLAIDRARVEAQRDAARDEIDAARATAADIVETANTAVEVVRQEARDEARRIRQSAERDAAESERIRQLVETANSNLVKAANAAAHGTHDEPVTREHVQDEVEFTVLCEHAPQSRPTRGFWYRFWSLNDARTGAPLALPEKIRAGLKGAFDVVAGLARRVAAVVRREAALERERGDWDAGREAREQALADARAAQARAAEIEEREARLAGRERAVASAEDAVASLTAGLAEMVKGTYDKRVTIEDVGGDARQLEVLERRTTKRFPTRGFRHRFHSVNFPDSGEPRALPGGMREGLRKSFDEMERFSWEFTRAAQTEAQRDAILQKARTEAAGIIEDYETRREAALATLERDPEVQQGRAFLKLMNDTLRRTLGEDVFQRWADAVNAAWADHPENRARQREIEPPTPPNPSQGRLPPGP